MTVLHSTILLFLVGMAVLEVVVSVGIAPALALSDLNNFGLRRSGPRSPEIQ